jgi:hypothetical protein
MKVASTIARYLLGLIFTVFGLNGFLNFIHQPPPANSLQHFAGKGTASDEETSRQVPFVVSTDGSGADEGLSQRVGAG